MLMAVVASTLVMVTAWYGGELVYRYGLGVISSPTTQTAGDHHNPINNKNSHSHDHPD